MESGKKTERTQCKHQLSKQKVEKTGFVKRVTLIKTIYICWVFKMVEWNGKLSKLIQE